MPYMKDKVKVNGRALREYRKGLFPSQEALAEKAGISRSYLSEIELGKKDPGRRIIERLADVLNVDVERLVVE